jgi:hypothetical protein
MKKNYVPLPGGVIRRVEMEAGIAAPMYGE